MTNVDTTPEMLPMNGSMVTDITHIDLDCIRCDEDIQTREVREGEALDQLRELYRDDPDALPPVIVFLDDWGDYWLADGFYRVKVAREAMGTGAPHTIRAEVRKGTKRNAILCAVTANAKHGLPLTAAEKRGVVERLLQDGQGLVQPPGGQVSFGQHAQGPQRERVIRAVPGLLLLQHLLQ